METYKYKWQIFIGAALLLCLTALLFFPRMSISGEDYVDMAVSVHEYAREVDKESADRAGAEEFLRQYQKEGEIRSSRIESYDRTISRRTGDHPHISGLYLARWGIRVSHPLALDGIICREGVSAGDSGVQGVFHGMGVLLLLPAMCGVVLLVFMLARRRTYGLWLLLTGIVTIGTELVLYVAMPSLIWGRIRGYVDSFSLIPSGLLEIPGVGQKAVTEMYRGSMDIAGWLTLLVGGLLIIAGVLFLTVCRPERIPKPGQIPGPGLIPAKGVITGLQGQYRGQSVPLEAGEELILGRDPAYSMLVFSHPGISRRHCGIRYDVQTGNYQLIDYSSTGTRLSDGSLVCASAYTAVSAGTVVYLGSTGEVVQLG